MVICAEPLKCSFGLVLREPYFFKGLLRFDWGFTTPNIAAAFIGCLLPYLWTSPWTQKWQRWLLLCLQTILAVFLVLTGSRGGMLACLLVYGWTLWFSHRHGSLQSERRQYCLVICVLLCGLIPFRLNPAYLLHDGSAINRIAVWKASLVLMATRPAGGWHETQSLGELFCNYFQAPNEHAYYITLVSTFFTLIAKWGVLAAWALIYFFASIVALHSSAMRAGNCVLSIATASLLIWLTANIFSTLYQLPILWLSPCCSLAFAGTSVIRTPNLLSALQCQIVVFTTSATAILFTAGWLLNLTTQPSLMFSREVICLSKPFQQGECIELWEDPEVLGYFPGRTERQLVARLQGVKTICCRSLRSGTQSLRVPSRSDACILSGRYVDQLKHATESYPGARIILLNPLLPPPGLCPANKSALEIILGEYDESGVNAPWIAWGHANSVPVFFLPGVGTDIRPSLEALVLRLTQ